MRRTTRGSAVPPSVIVSGPVEVSVVTVVHNGMPYLPRTAESVLGQDYRRFEWLVVDDDSTDDTPQYMRSLEDDRVRYCRLEKTGLVGVRNFTLEHARAELVAIIDSDDVAYPARLEAQAAYMTDHPQCCVLGCQADLIDEQDDGIGRRSYPLADAAIRWQMFFGSPFLQPGSMLRRSRALACGGYRPEFPNAEDYDLWTRMAPLGQLANHPATLMRYRIHPRSMTGSRQEEQLALCKKAAAGYAERFAPGLGGPAVEELYGFLAVGSPPGTVGYHDLVIAYRAIKRAFLERIEDPGEEAVERIETIQRYLRWRCLERAQENLLLPWRAWRWLRLAAGFDPENGTLWRILRRALGRRRCHRSAPAAGQDPGLNLP